MIESPAFADDDNWGWRNGDLEQVWEHGRAPARQTGPRAAAKVDHF
jgi:hypothetical protein